VTEVTIIAFADTTLEGSHITAFGTLSFCNTIAFTEICQVDRHLTESSNTDVDPAKEIIGTTFFTTFFTNIELT